MAWFNDFGTTRKWRLGTVKTSVAGNKYIYLQGVAATTANDVVTFNAAGGYVTALAVADAVGPVAVAQSACVANNFGWYQIWGNSTVNTDASVATNVQMFLTATPGDVDDADVAGDTIIGMVSTAADDSTALTTAVFLNYPHVTNQAID